MPATVALLRAVNLGARNKVPMAELRAACAELGYDDVSTFIASGNVIFPTRAPKPAELERLIADRFGVATTAVYRSAAQLKALARAKPFGARTPECHVAFLAAKAKLDALAADDYPDESWEQVGPDLALLYPDAFHRARLNGARLERLLGVQVTLRNWRTAAKLAELATAASADG